MKQPSSKCAGESAEHEPSSPTTSALTRRSLAALVAACVIGRGAYVLYLVHEHAIVTDSGDAPSYLLPARQLLEHGRFDSGNPPGLPEFLRTPGYPAFIAAVFRVFGQTITSVLLVQVAISALTVLLAYVLAARMWSPKVGLFAAAFTLLEPLQNATSATVLTECVAALLLMAAATVGFIAFTREGLHLGLWALLGLIIAYAALVRPGLYYLPLFVMVLLPIRFASRERRRHLVATVAAFFLPLVVILGGWQYRNHIEVGSWRFSGIEARNLYRYRAAGVVADTSGISFRAAQLALGRKFGPLGDEQQGPYYGRMYRAAMHILFAHPLDSLLGAVRGLGSELFGVRSKFFAYLGIRPASGVVVLLTCALIGFYALCAYGIVLTARRREALLGHVFVLGIAVYVFVSSAGPEAFGGRGERFRAPVMPILILYGALGAHTVLRDRLGNLFRARRREASPALPPPER